MKKDEHKKDLQILFGEPVTYLAQMTDVTSLDLTAELMHRVHDGADTLLSMRGQVQLQQEYINGLPFTLRLVLCMWLMDTEMAAKIVRSALSRA